MRERSLWARYAYGWVRENNGFFNNLLGRNVPDAIVGRLRLMSQLHNIAVFDHRILTTHLLVDGDKHFPLKHEWHEGAQLIRVRIDHFLDRRRPGNLEFDFMFAEGVA